MENLIPTAVPNFFLKLRGWEGIFWLSSTLTYNFPHALTHIVHNFSEYRRPIAAAQTSNWASPSETAAVDILPTGTEATTDAAETTTEAAEATTDAGSCTEEEAGHSGISGKEEDSPSFLKWSETNSANGSGR